MPDTRQPATARTPQDLRAIAARCQDRAASGFIVTPDSVSLFAQAMLALAEKVEREERA